MDSDDDADWTSVSCILTKTYLPRILMKKPPTNGKVLINQTGRMRRPM